MTDETEIPGTPDPYEVRNIVQAVDGYTCELNHPEFGWIGYTASATDVVEMSRELYAQILAGEHGEVAPYVPIKITIEEVERARQVAYANPVTGSDRKFAEVTRMIAMGEEGVEAVRAEAIARFNEIQAAYPWPAE